MTPVGGRKKGGGKGRRGGALRARRELKAIDSNITLRLFYYFKENLHFLSIPLGTPETI